MERMAKSSTPLVFVTFGSSGYQFDRLLNLLTQTDAFTDNRVEWIIQMGYEPVNPPRDGIKFVNLISRKEMEEYVKKASLVVSHCGIGSLNMMLRYQKQVFFVPRVAKYGEFSDDHQLQIAGELKNETFKVVLPDMPFPEISFDSLAGIEIDRHPIDIVNYAFAEQIKKLLIG